MDLAPCTWLRKWACGDSARDYQIRSRALWPSRKRKKDAFHIAAVKGKAEIVSEMLTACEECIEDVKVQKESALHLAMKNSQFESMKVMLDWVRLKKKDEILNMKDEQGNTILHLAVWKKQMQVLQLLLDAAATTLEINAMNQSGLTPLDLLLIFPSEAGDRELLELLHFAGAVRARDITVLISEPHQNREVIDTSTNLLDYFKFHKERDSPSDVRTILLIIAVLVATVTYQVGINPPGGSWQDDSPTGTNTTSPGKAHMAGTSIMGTNNIFGYTMLVASNSIGFSLSVTMIGLLTSNFPLQVELQFCLMALSFTCNISLINSAPGYLRSFNVVCASVVPAVISVTAFWMRKYRLWKVVGDLLRRGN